MMADGSLNMSIDNDIYLMAANESINASFDNDEYLMMANGSINASTENDDYLTYDSNFEFPKLYKTIRNCVAWAIIGLVLSSLFGNIMIIAVMLQKRNRKSSTSSFFIALAVSDMSLAFSVSFERWLLLIYNVSVYGINSYITTTKVILTYSNVQFSSWMLACITVERVLSIAMPFRIKEICSKTRAEVIIFIVFVVILCLNTVEFTLLVDIRYIEGMGMIHINKVDDGELIIAWTDFANSFFIPINIIVIGSVYIIVNLLRVNVNKQVTNKHRNKSVTMTLLGANIVFVLTMSPFVFLHLAIFHFNSLYLFQTVSHIFMFLSDMNCALNFFVYVLSGAKFRSDVMQLLGFKIAKP
jgi:hypothetical protein